MTSKCVSVRAALSFNVSGFLGIVGGGLCVDDLAGEGQGSEGIGGCVNFEAYVVCVLF
jgi:hypothetical protein